MIGLGKGVRVLSPEGAIAPTGTWSLGARAGDFVFVAGMRGINPMNNRLVDGDDGHDIACKIDGIGAINLKSEFVKKA